MELKVKTQKPEIASGSFTRKEAAHLVANGCRHLHSSIAGSADNLASLTERSVDGKNTPTYPWESGAGQKLVITNSKERSEILHAIFQDPAASGRRHIKEKIETVFEELTSNAIYHSYQASGKEKYPRLSPVTLGAKEQIQVRYHWSKEGFFLEVTDQGGSLKFDHIADAFRRCYSGDDNKIESKESGAGLGFYMVFEIVNHLKVQVRRKESTSLSVWISDKRSNESSFSFNFFENNPSTGRQP